MCGIQYIGKTTQKLKARAAQHRRSFNKLSTHIAKHFSDESHVFSIKPICHLKPGDFENKNQCDKELIKQERYWMKELNTIYPFGLNERVDGVGDVSKSNINVETLFNDHQRRKRSHGTRRNSHLYDDWTLDTLMDLYKEDDINSIHKLRTVTYSLPNKIADKIQCTCFCLALLLSSKCQVS